MDEIRTALLERQLAVRAPASGSDLRALQSGFRNPLPAWLLGFLAGQDGMSLGPVDGINPFTRERLTFTPEWIAGASTIAKVSSFLNSRSKLECVVIGEFDSDFITEF